MLYDYAVVIGRFNPLHLGHCDLLQKAAAKAKHLIVLIGSANGPRNIKNPFTFSERAQIISDWIKTYNPTHVPNHSILPLQDSKYNDAEWIKQVQLKVASVDVGQGWQDKPHSVCLIGFEKEGNDYLKWFPQWDFISIEHEYNLRGLSATDIREMLFDDNARKMSFVKSVVPQDTMSFIANNCMQSWWTNLCDEYAFIKEYKKQWANAPYAPTFVTVDAIVIQDGHVLMVKRKANPGKGQWALPGGFINQNERIKDAVIRELREETRIKVPEAVLRGSILVSDVFDFPERSLRGRTITHAYLIKLASTGKLPVVKGSDDALAAKWIPLSHLTKDDIYEDHFDIINAMVGKL